MQRMCAFLVALILAEAGIASPGPGHAARLGYSRAYCLSETLPAVEAVSACTAALQKLKNNAVVLLRRGAAFGELGAFDYAIGDFSRAIRLAPDHALALRLRGLAYEMRGRMQESLADYRRLQDLGRSDSEIEAAIRRIALTVAPIPAVESAAAPRAPEPSPAAPAEPVMEIEAPPPGSAIPGLALPAAGLILAGAALVAWRVRRRNTEIAV
ncbi:MAG: hypothetical protein EKK29_16335 [Hyphomicrobiales bacterium]|nr:MAG: hypothetical protein EKK29_16335 [Hyphomicrobiales bacterium]